MRTVSKFLCFLLFTLLFSNGFAKPNLPDRYSINLKFHVTNSTGKYLTYTLQSPLPDSNPLHWSSTQTQQLSLHDPEYRFFFNVSTPEETTNKNEHTCAGQFSYSVKKKIPEITTLPLDLPAGYCKFFKISFSGGEAKPCQEQKTEEGKVIHCEVNVMAQVAPVNK